MTAHSAKQEISIADHETKNSTTPIDMTTLMPTLNYREQLKVDFYKTYDIMTGVRIAATLGGFFSLMVLLVIYKSRCKSNKQLQDPQLTAAAAAAVAEAEAEERALAVAIEAITRLPPEANRGPRRSLCFETRSYGPHPAVLRFASVGGGYDSLLAPMRQSTKVNPFIAKRRYSSVTCSSIGSGYSERRGSTMVMPSLPLSTSVRRHGVNREPWDLHYPIDIQIIQPTPDLSPTGSEVAIYESTKGIRKVPHEGRRAPLEKMESVDPNDPDSHSIGSDSVFLNDDDGYVDTEDEVSGFSTDSEIPGPSQLQFLKVPVRRKNTLEKWDSCVGCLPRRRTNEMPSQTSKPGRTSAGAPRSDVPLTNNESPSLSPPLELRHPISLVMSPTVWAQETLF